MALVLSFLSIGFLGTALYYGNPNNWSGDWVWPAVIAAGMLWSVSFLAAGWINLYLTPHLPAAARGIIHVAVLWLSAALVWLFILATSYEPTAAKLQADMARCGEVNRSYIETGLSGAFETLPPILDGPRCLKTPYSSDMVAAVRLHQASRLTE